MKLHIGDCIEVLGQMPEASVDAVVTDPPYGLSFMGKRWDYDVPAASVWAECLRVLKPGGHLLAFAGTRTQHRMAVRIEDAGFEIRDMIAWVYGSGFPKSLDISKAIDKRGGDMPEFEAFRDAVRQAMQTSGISHKQLSQALGNCMLGHYLTKASQPAVPNPRDYRIIRDAVGLGTRFDSMFNEQADRPVVGEKSSGLSAGSGNTVRFTDSRNERGMVNITAPATPKAQQWSGWGTALKPSLEPITVARKPFGGTVSGNVMQHGTGALNIDASRTAGNRWPANLIHDGSDEVIGAFTSTASSGAGAARFFYCAKASKRDRDEGLDGFAAAHRVNGNKWTDKDYRVARGQRPPTAESGPRRNIHPTVKPTALMRYLCRLVTPPSGIVLDPFMGSGSTGKAATLEGFDFVGIERDADYFRIAEARIAWAQSQPKQQGLKL